MKDEFQERIIGRKINGYELLNVNQLLRLRLDNGPLDIYAHGDCCSSSWFEGVAGDEALEGGAEILEFTMIEVGEVSNRDPEDDYSKTEQYGIKIKTTNGWCDIDMRNESNGYYSGFISLDPNKYGGESMYPESR